MEIPEDVCLICDVRPAGYVPVVDRDDALVGRICSTHTLWDVIRVGLFTIRLEFWPDDENNE